MSAISNIVAQYAGGQIDFQQARERMRPIEAAPYEHSNPYTNEWQEHEGGYVELMSACVVHDLTSGEYEVLRCELSGTTVDETILTDPSNQNRLGLH